jgi:microcystin-dependent protein
MAKIRHLAQGTALPEWFLDLFQEEMTGYASANFAVSKLNDTTLQVRASAADQVGIALTNPAGTALGFRYNTADATGAVPGGLAAGDHDVFVTASANAFGSNPAPPPAELDNTPKAFGLRLLAAGATPSGTGTEAYYRKVATFYWDGARITEVRPLVGSAAATPAKHASTHAPGARDELDWPAVGDAAIPAGVMAQYGGAAAPSGWLLCDGASVLRADYPDLFNALGGTASPWGLPDGTHFSLPDMRGRVAAGRDAAQTEFAALGQTGGVKTHALTIAQMPAHSHGGATGGGTSGTDSPDHAHGGYTDTAGNFGGWTDSQGSHTHGFDAPPVASNATRNLVITGSSAYSIITSGANMQAAGAHSHNVGVNPHSHGITTYGANARHAHAIPALAIGVDGGGAAHTNVQPYTTVNHIIKT